VFVPVSAQGKALADHPNVELSTPLLF